ncbi:hypothetical protein H0A58_03425 [Alcaligenaceae bacterium]|nr:hypothetical protein [Alcaligenaceae bacterium]
MSLQRLGRYGFSLFFVALVSGCVSSDINRSGTVENCRWNPSSCMHEGSYQPGEQEYAEQEAQDLNRAESIRLHRRSRWW